MDYVYLWADGIHVNIRLEEHKLCLLVMIGVRADGRKELIALADGYRESAESWADLLRDCARRGMRAPVLAVGDGALGFWNGLRRCFPRPGRAAAGSTRRPTCWLPAEVRAPGREEGPGGDLGRRRQAACPRRGEGLRCRLRREVPQGHGEDHRRYGGAAGVLRLPVRALGAPAHHEPDRVHLRHGPAPDQGHQGPRSRAAGLAMAFKLIESAQDRWRAVNAPHLVALVRAGATFINGKLIERPGENTEPEAA